MKFIERLWASIIIGLSGICLAIGVNASENTPSYKIIPHIAETHNITRKEISVLESTMSYLEEGSGEAIVFIHGNPAYSYLWRNIMPEVSCSARTIAPDLIGMGYSGKPDIDYTFNDHYRYFEAFIKALNIEHVTLVGHDWGAAIAWQYALKNPHKVNKLAFMEGLLPPTFPVASYEAMGEEMGNMFRAFNDTHMGTELVIKQHIFIEQVLPGFVNRTLGETAMEAYREPYLEEKSRQLLLQWPRQVPIAGEPQATKKRLENITKFMAKTTMPVLLLYAKPGVVTPEEAVSWYIATIKNIEAVFVGTGYHFIQEDQPEAIGKAINDWHRREG